MSIFGTNFPFSAEREPIITTEGLHKTFGELEVLHGIDVAVAARKLTLITGASGSGKSTFLNCISGLDKPDSGGVYFGEVDLTKLSTDTLQKVRAKYFGFLFQAPHLLSGYGVKDNIRLQHNIVGNLIDPDRYDHVVETLGISDLLHASVNTLSGGQQQRVALARALVHGPQVVFADEPTYALDSANKQRVHELLSSFVEEGATVVMVSHEESAPHYADEIITLHDGNLVEN